MTSEPLDLAGVGIGPFNLSLAAQLDAIDGVDARFFDQQPGFDWHPGMMLPDVTLQTSFLKDLVTATNPTSPWSFLAYLVAHKRFYDFLNAEFAAIPRQEFARYLGWVAARLPSLQFATPIDDITFDGREFVLASQGSRIRARNVALGVGLQPALPAFAAKLTGHDHFHSSRTAFEIDRTAGKRVAVIGGGQSGAEIVLHLLGRGASAPAHIDWISMRPNYQPLDETPFTNELFTPQYMQSFHNLPEARRASVVERDKLAGDGVSAATLSAIYRRLYTLQHIENAAVTTALLPHREVLDVDQSGRGVRLIMRNGLDGRMEFAQADMIVLATGYSFRLPECLAPLAGRLALDSSGRLRLDADFAVHWDGPKSNRIFALNAGLISHGIAEPQLSLMAWRSAVIANAVAGRPHFDVDMPPGFVEWSAGAGEHSAPSTMST
ncbi:lysine N(6)-hydroxylase/L-ornithine N(5)-oxygenase family protein [Chelatococcus reniformis]|uniref:Lysine 6-monooxygenase n=1 Tax=Chelatococcus reniformis TaxID=1494448 RepID=A0A916XP31_9HYPH|nr:SidA/IucD/PvdA family monooxygenase [Chelatococcus reniformis]GGC88926.1 lysine 6-monooxygenase [Chelatococcus reniformis]